MRARTDILVLILLFVLGVLYAYVTKDLFIGKGVLVAAIYIIPSIIYLNLRAKLNWPKIIVSALIFGGLFGFFFEFIQEYTHAYVVTSSIFPFKILGVLPPDNVIAHIMMTALTIAFYQRFIPHKESKSISKFIVIPTISALLAILILLILFFANPSLLQIPLPYFLMGLAAILFPILLGILKPEFIKNMALIAIFFFFLYFFAELVAVNLNWWIYPGNNYVGWVTIFNTTFPFEELFFWIMFYAATLISYYEVWVNNDITKLLKS